MAAKEAENNMAEEQATRPDDDDYDLLTFGEANARLSEEVARQRELVEALRSAGEDTHVASAVEAAQDRLDALLAAQRRNRKPSADELRSAGFFGRRG